MDAPSFPSVEPLFVKREDEVEEEEPWRPVKLELEDGGTGHVTRIKQEPCWRTEHAVADHPSGPELRIKPEPVLDAPRPELLGFEVGSRHPVPLPQEQQQHPNVAEIEVVLEGDTSTRRARRPGRPRGGKSEAGRHRCHLCGHGSRCESALRTHAMTHSGERPWACRLCRAAFARPAALRRHVAGRHGAAAGAGDRAAREPGSGADKNGRESGSKGCGQGPGARSDPKSVPRVSETGSNSSKSAPDGRETEAAGCPQPAGRSRQTRVACPVCAKQFGQASALNVHLRTHPGAGGPRRCQACRLDFASAASFKDHMVTHAGRPVRPCPLCGRNFVSASACARHLRSHDSCRPHKCFVCGGNFAERSNLDLHVRCLSHYT